MTASVAGSSPRLTYVTVYSTTSPGAADRAGTTRVVRAPFAVSTTSFDCSMEMTSRGFASAGAESASADERTPITATLCRLCTNLPLQDVSAKSPLFGFLTPYVVSGSGIKKLAEEFRVGSGKSG